MTKVMRKEARHTQRRDRASEVPLEILVHEESVSRALVECNPDHLKTCSVPV